MDEQRDRFGVEPVCRVLGVAVSTYYARRARRPSRRELQDRELVGEIQAARAGYRRVYGVRKTWKELRRRGVEVGRDRVGRLMRREGLEGVRRGKKKRTTIPDEAAAERARDLLQRDFTATRPNEKWVADLTYVRTWQGFCYLAFLQQTQGASRPVPTPEQPQQLCLDRGYDSPPMHALVIKHGYTLHIRACGEEIKLKARTPGWRARRWIVEATHSLAEPKPRHPHPLVQEGLQPPRPAPARLRPDRLQESPHRVTRHSPTGIGPKRTGRTYRVTPMWPTRRACSSSRSSSRTCV